MNSKPTGRRWRLLAVPLALTLLACGATSAQADFLEVDQTTFIGPEFDGVVYTTPGATVNRKARTRLRRAGTNHLAVGSNVQVIPQITPPGYTLGGGNITVPGPWGNGAFVNLDVDVTATAPTTLGRHDSRPVWTFQEPVTCQTAPCMASSAEVTGKTFFLYVQPRPASNVDVALDGLEASASWTASPDADQISGYTVTRYVKNQPMLQRTWDVPASATSIDDDGLAPGTEYCWSVQAYYLYAPDSAALISTRVEQCATTNGVPSAPGAPVAPATDRDGDYEVSWGAATDPDGDDLTYTLQRKDSNDADWTTVDDNISATTRAVSEDEGAQRYRVRATDPTGNVGPWAESNDATVVDGTPPSAPQASTDGTPNGDGWFKDAVEVSFGGSSDQALADGSAGTGVASYSAPVAFDSEGSHTASGTATDGVGNESAATELTVKVDTSVPQVEITCPTDPILEGRSATATWTAADSGSGLATGAEGTTDLDTATAGTHTATAPVATDKVGHDSAAATCEYEVYANSAPAVPGAPTGPAIDRDGDFEVSWDASVDPDGDDVTYALERKDADDADWSLVADGIGGTTHAVHEGEGTYEYRVRATDTHDAASDPISSAPVVVDGTPPSAPQAGTDSTPNGDGWFRDAVKVSFDGSTDPGLADGSAGTGVASYTDPVTFATQGTHSASGTATDGAGNESAATELTVKVDTTDPTVEISCPTIPLLAGSSANADWTAEDTGSGLATPASGQIALDTATAGTHSVNAPVAKDGVGHESAPVSCSYAVYSNGAPGAPGAPGGPTSDRDGDFIVRWDAAVDPDGDALKYTLEKRDANDSDWSAAGSDLAANELAVHVGEGSWSFRVKADDGRGAGSEWVQSVRPVKVDQHGPSAPVATTDPAAPSSGGWFKDTVGVSFGGSTDPGLADGSTGSGVESYDGAERFSTDGEHTARGTATDFAGNESAATAVTVRVDATAPAVQITCPTEPLTVGQTGATARWTASDGQSGLATAASGNVALDTSRGGTRTVSAPVAKDKVGHSSATVSCEYEVQYRFVGVGAPYEGSNLVNVGLGNRTYPIRWKLKKADGSTISDADGVALAAQMSASSRQVECLSYLRREENSLAETTAAAADTLRYDTSNNQFVYSYKAPRRGCHVLSIKKADGVDTATWRFLFI